MDAYQNLISGDKWSTAYKTLLEKVLQIMTKSKYNSSFMHIVFKEIMVLLVEFVKCRV